MHNDIFIVRWYKLYKYMKVQSVFPHQIMIRAMTVGVSPSNFTVMQREFFNLDTFFNFSSWYRGYDSFQNMCPRESEQAAHAILDIPIYHLILFLIMISDDR